MPSYRLSPWHGICSINGRFYWWGTDSTKGKVNILIVWKTGLISSSCHRRGNVVFILTQWIIWKKLLHKWKSEFTTQPTDSMLEKSSVTEVGTPKHKIRLQYISSDTAEIIKTILAAKAGSSPPRGPGAQGATQTGQRRSRPLGPEDGAGACRAGRRLPGGFSKLDNRCWATARAGYQDESKCWWPMMELYVRSRSAEPTHRERLFTYQGITWRSLDYFFLSLSQHLQLVSSTYFHALPSLFSQDVSEFSDTYSYSLILVITPLNT